MFPFHFV